MTAVVYELAARRARRAENELYASGLHTVEALIALDPPAESPLGVMLGQMVNALQNYELATFGEPRTWWDKA